MSTDTDIQNETVLHDEVDPTATTVETASASDVTEPAAERLTETIENHAESEVSSSNGLNTNGPTTNTETTENFQKDQRDSDNVDEQEVKTSTLNKNDLEPESFRKVFIGGLCYKTDDQTFRDYFSKFGDILDCIIMRDREGRSRGFGFVTYASRSMVDQLMSNRPHNLDGREIEPKRAIPREESGKPEASLTAKKLFVGGIREGALNETDLQNYFSKYGHIIDTIIMKSQDGKCRGFGFVEFDDYDPVDQIVLERHHTINNNPVNVEKALPKEQTNRGRMNQQSYGGPSPPMRGPPSRSSAAGWGPMKNEPPYGGHSHMGNGYPPNNGQGNYGPGDYGSRSGSYGSGYSSDMHNQNGPRGHNGNMIGYGGGNSAPLNGNGYGGSGSSRGNYNDSYPPFGLPPSGPNFGQGYGSNSGGGPMRRSMGPSRNPGIPYARGRGGAAPSFHGRN